MPGAWGHTAVIAAVGAMVFALAVHLQWRSWVLCQGVWPWLRWIINFIDFWLWLPIGTAMLLGLIYVISLVFPARPGAWIATILLQGVGAYPAVLLGPVAGIIVYKGWLLYFLWWWDPVRGLFRAPAWPRQPYSRGPQERRRREFREPLPWDRGPGSW